MSTKERIQTLLIGIFVVASLAVGSWLLLFLSPETGDGSQTIYVRFTDIDKVTIGTRVTFGGQPIGEVLEIRQVPDARLQKSGLGDDVYIYELKLSIDSSVTVFNTDSITVRTSGLLGEKSISIMPRKPRRSVESFPINQNHVLRAEGGGSVEEALLELEGLATKAGTALDEIIDLIEANNKDINLAIKSMYQSLSAFSIFMERLNELDVPGSFDQAAERFTVTIDKLSTQLAIVEERDLMNKISNTTEHIESVVAAIDQPENLSSIITNVRQLSEGLGKLQERVNGSWDKVDNTLEDFAAAGKNTRELTEDAKASAQRIIGLANQIADGEGSIGRLLNSDDFYLRVTSVMSKLETIMNDVNHYGILFHLDKGWQRQRVRRMNLLQDISNAQQFRDYFEEEVDQINASLSRVSMLLQRGEHGRLEDCDERFKGVFADLLRQVDGLESALKLYNSSLTEPQG